MQKKRFSIIPDAEKKSIFGALSLEGKSERYREIAWFTGSLVAVGVIYAIIFVWGQQIEGRTSNLTEQKEELQRLVTNNEERRELESFVERLKTIEQIINETKYPSEFFPIFTSSASRFVAIEYINLNVTTLTLSIRAEADSLETMGSQLVFWRENTGFIESILQSNFTPTGEGGGRVAFSVSFQIKPEFLQFQTSPESSDQNSS